MDTREQLEERIRSTKNYATKLAILLEMFPEDIVGIDKETLGSLHFGQSLDYYSVSQVKIRRRLFDYLSKVTNTRRASVERGVSSFFKRKLNLKSSRVYNGEWAIYGDINRAAKACNLDSFGKARRASQKDRAVLSKGGNDLVSSGRDLNLLSDLEWTANAQRGADALGGYDDDYDDDEFQLEGKYELSIEDDSGYLSDFLSDSYIYM